MFQGSNVFFICRHQNSWLWCLWYPNSGKYMAGQANILSSEFGTFAYFTPIDNIQMVFGVCQARKG